MDKSPQPPVSSVPPELLEEIFKCLHVAHMGVAQASVTPFVLRPQEEDITPLQQRIAVSQVCRLWRDIAIGCSQLWTIIPLHNIAWADISLQRSKSAPIFVDLPAQARIDGFALDVCLKSLNRFSVFRMSPLSYSKEAVLNTSLAPQLQELRMTGSFLTDDIFRGTIPPRLTTLVLTDCFFSDSLPILSANLTHLHLSLTRSPWRSSAALFDSLRHAPRLETLSLEKATIPFEFPNGGEISIPSLSLPHLSGLSIHGPLEIIVPFFQVLRTPNLRKAIFLITLFTDDLTQRCNLIRKHITAVLHRETNGPHSHRSIHLSGPENSRAGENRILSIVTASYNNSAPLDRVRAIAKGGKPLPNDIELELGILGICTEGPEHGSVYITSILAEVLRALPAAQSSDLQLSRFSASTEVFREAAVAHAGPSTMSMHIRGESTTAMMLGVPSTPSVQDRQQLHSPFRLPGFPDLRFLQISSVSFMDNEGEASPLFQQLLSACNFAAWDWSGVCLVLVQCRLSQVMEDQLRGIIGVGRGVLLLFECERTPESPSATPPGLTTNISELAQEMTLQDAGAIAGHGLEEAAAADASDASGESPLEPNSAPGAAAASSIPSTPSASTGPDSTEPAPGGSGSARGGRTRKFALRVYHALRFIRRPAAPRAGLSSD